MTAQVNINVTNELQAPSVVILVDVVLLLGGIEIASGK